MLICLKFEIFPIMKRLLSVIFLLIGLFSHGQFTDKAHFTHAVVSIGIAPTSKEIRGKVLYDFHVVDHADSIFLDAQNLQFSDVRLNNKKVRFLNDQKTITIKNNFKKGKTYRVSLVYTANPKQTVYFIGWDGQTENNQVWTQGQGKYTSHWLPSFDDMTEKVEFDLSITFDKEYEVIANGKLVGVKETGPLKTWTFDMEKPMSSYLLAFAIGGYKKNTLISESGIHLEMYYYPSDSAQIEPTYRYTQRIFDFLEREIGVGYPWQNYKQVPVRDFLYAGMENTGTTIFSDAYMIDSIAFKDRNYVNINAHELAHQWFGNLVTEVDGDHHWLHEGFATYYALLTEKAIFGDSYFYWKLYESAIQLDELSRKGLGEALTDPKASSLTFYEKGAWALYMLRNIVGEQHFKEGIGKYLLSHQFKNVTVTDFISEMERTSGMDLSNFKETWLYGTGFSMKAAKQQLMEVSDELSDLFQMQQELITSAVDKEKTLKKYWDKSNSNRLKQEIISGYTKSLPDGFLRNAFGSGDMGIRQALAINLQQIPINLKAEYESLLKDKSYLTIENALYRLWVYFPSDRNHYLERTKDLVGFPNKNIRILWLTLAMLTKDYDMDKKQDYYRELSGYTSKKYSFEIRQTAFQYLEDTFVFTDQNLLDLINATMHHSWQFRKFARDVLDKTLKDKDYKKRIRILTKELKEDELRYITTKLSIE